MYNKVHHEMTWSQFQLIALSSSRAIDKNTLSSQHPVSFPPLVIRDIQHSKEVARDGATHFYLIKKVTFNSSSSSYSESRIRTFPWSRTISLEGFSNMSITLVKCRLPLAVIWSVFCLPWAGCKPVVIIQWPGRDCASGRQIKMSNKWHMQTTVVLAGKKN